MGICQAVDGNISYRLKLAIVVYLLFILPSTTDILFYMYMYNVCKHYFILIV